MRAAYRERMQKSHFSFGDDSSELRTSRSQRSEATSHTAIPDRHVPISTSNEPHVMQKHDTKPGVYENNSKYQSPRLQQYERRRQQYMSGRFRQPQPQMPNTSEGAGKAGDPQNPAQEHLSSSPHFDALTADTQVRSSQTKTDSSHEWQRPLSTNGTRDQVWEAKRQQFFAMRKNTVAPANVSHVHGIQNTMPPASIQHGRRAGSVRGESRHPSSSRSTHHESMAPQQIPSNPSYSSENEFSHRRNVRVMRPPGGGSSIQFG